MVSRCDIPKDFRGKKVVIRWGFSKSETFSAESEIREVTDKYIVFKPHYPGAGITLILWTALISITLPTKKEKP